AEDPLRHLPHPLAVLFLECVTNLHPGCCLDAVVLLHVETEDDWCESVAMLQCHRAVFSGTHLTQLSQFLFGPKSISETDRTRVAPIAVSPRAAPRSACASPCVNKHINNASLISGLIPDNVLPTWPGLAGSRVRSPGGSCL